jgi:long-chain acyl-CoA synthetase
MDLATMAGRFPDRQAVVVDGRPVSYAELDRAANRLAHRLRDGGLRRGDALAVCAGNGIGVFEAYWAAMRLGLYQVPVNRHLKAPEIRHILTDVATLGSVGVITDDSTAAEVDEAAAGLPLAVRIALGDGPVAAAAPEDMPTDAWEGQLLLYSSGTSGQPKGVWRDLPGLRPGAGPTLGSELAEGFGLRAGDRYLSPGPLYHSAPLAFATACQRVGATAVVMTRFDPAAALDLLESEAITVSLWVPTMFVRLLGLPEEVRRAPRDLSSHRLAAHAGAPCPLGVKRAMIDWWGPILVEFYSGTEGGRTMITSADWLAHPGSVGRHWRGGRVWILDDGGRELAPGVDGRIYFEAPATGRFRYLNQPGATAAAYRGDRFTLGDVGHLDEEGWLYVTDRDSDMVISGGVNIYPREVENVLLEHPGVADAAVVGLPDDDLGERVVAAIEPREPASPVDPDDLIAFCRSRIAAFKCPKAVVFVDALNRSEAGKLDKRALEARLSSDDGSAG